MSLFSKRRKEREEAEARSRGERVDHLRDDAPQAFRQQLWFAMDTATTWGGSLDAREVRDYLMHRIRRYLCEEYGRSWLAANTGNDHATDLGRFVTQAAATHEVMDVIDAVITVLRQQIKASPSYDAQAGLTGFVDTVAQRMREHKLAYDIVEYQVVEKRSEELHQAAVAPALTLLHGRPRFADAERQYRDALNELAKGRWADAITDANAAVENVLRTLVGFSQGQLPGLLAEARARGLFGDPQSARIKKVVTGLSALSDVRNAESDAHGHVSDEATGWLAVHWSAALIVYLVQRAEDIGL